jgi:hypothetical protein
MASAGAGAIQAVHQHRRLVKLLRLAYSAERAAAFAYIGHAGSVSDERQKAALRQIEADEWEHRASVLKLLRTYDIPVSRILEVRFFLVGKLISASCYVIGWFMPYYFAGRLESGNVCEYFIMQQYFHELGITDHDQVLYEMGMTEKEHEQFFLDGMTHKRLLPIFQRVFGWGSGASYNDVDLAAPHDPALSSQYCQRDSDPSDRVRPSRRLRTIAS